MKYDLEERTAKFAVRVIELVKKITPSPINKRIIEQVVGSSGSIGANYNEANEGESKKDFYHKISISKKEIKETQHWLRLLAAAEPQHKTELRNLWQEAHELILIFAKILASQKS
ncbi:MAG: hypothetical protein UY16_C0063G0002 [Candidatus Gottesmanbacteria bacterium GW2011_GWA2_47_9]|uniref:Four helix bundle protein n=1 Tax=Candidatus Gottesmanbacteria bacterium GW2011_GWA2_47_9 TaxID=1618445 RepID=A0A0G1TWA2_9BACT|nr:MAG: hypothetical protein UY16_C0063G0002 [Candidatus Gottesmanbacteria bacterium GW2011_GWA2_47_9]